MQNAGNIVEVTERPEEEDILFHPPASPFLTATLVKSHSGAPVTLQPSDGVHYTCTTSTASIELELTVTLPVL